MKNKSRNQSISQFSLRFKPLLSSSETGYAAFGSIPERIQTGEIPGPKPRLEKSGGMPADVRDFLSQHCILSDPSFSILRTSHCNVINRLPDHTTTIVNLKRINDIREINKFFSAVNRKLPQGGTFIGCVETKYMRRQRILKKFPPLFNRIYFTLDFILKRVFPKLSITRWIYFMLT